MSEMHEIKSLIVPSPPPLPLLSSSFQKPKLSPLVLNTSEFSKVNESQLDFAVKNFLSCGSKFSKIFYLNNTYVIPQLQDGPKCGLVALSIATSVNGNFVNVEDIFQTAVSLGLTKQGEIFSAESLALLAEKCCGFKTKILKKGLANHLHCIVRSLMNKCLILVPYDADANHSPCLKKGFKAHWAVITGFFVIEPKHSEKKTESNNFVILNSPKCSSLCNCIDYSCDKNLPLTFSIHEGKILIGKESAGIHDNFNEGKIYLIGMQGKSRHIGLWPFDEMAASNDNLFYLSPNRDADYFILPEGGLEEGLKGKSVILAYS